MMNSIFTKLVLLAIPVCILLSGCTEKEDDDDDDKRGSDDNSREKTSEVTTDDNPPFNMEDGSIVVGAASWPEDYMNDIEAPDATIEGVIKDAETQSCSVVFSGMSQSVADDYLEYLKEIGYSSVMEVNDGDGIVYMGERSDGTGVTFTYTISAQEASVSICQIDGNVTQSFSDDPVDDPDVTVSVNVDMSDVIPWPAALIPDIEELDGKITNVSNSNNEVIWVDFEYVEKDDFEEALEGIKEVYSTDGDEYSDADYWEYRGYNSNGDLVVASMNLFDKTVSIYVEKYVE